MTKRLLSRRIRTASVMLCSTAIAAVLAAGPWTAAADPEKKPAAAKTKQESAKSAPDARWAMPELLPRHVVRALTDAQWNGPLGLIAGVFEQVRDKPAARDAVLDYARGLAPAFSRDLTTAADLAVLTANDKLALAPNAADVLNARRAASTGAPTIDMASAFGTSPFGIGARALPPDAPSAANQTWNLTMIGAQTANARGYTGAGVSVAVGDTGFDINNDALKNKVDLTRAKNYIVNTATTPYDSTFVDVQSSNDKHGSHVAGIIAAEKLTGVDMRGVAYDAMIVPIRLVLGGSDDAPNAVYAPGVDDPFVNALDYFTSLSNVMVYNASYGPSPARTPALSVWSVSGSNEVAAVGRALAAGKIVVAASGNERSDHPVAGLNPSGIALYPYIQPGHANTGVYNDGGANLDFDELLTQRGLIVSVMSVGTDKKPAYYSNLCGVTASWCVAAPGGDQLNNLGVYSTVPDNTYAALQGTSMAAPTVSGALAVLIQAYPSYNARDLARLLFSTTEDIGDPGLDKVYGYGLIRLDRATEPVTALSANGTVTVAANNTNYWSPPVTTGGAFTKDGDGTLTIAGITNAPGVVTVAQGALAVDGTLNITGSGNRLMINSEGLLAGFGEINGNTTIAGTLSPGKMPNVQDQGVTGNYTVNSPGTLTFKGSVTLTSTADTMIAVDGNLNVPGGPGTFSRIIVTGAGNAFTANGTLTPVLRGIAGGVNNYTPALGTQLKIVDAQNGAVANGNFAALVQPTVGLLPNTRFDVDYATNSIALVITPASIAAELDDKTLSPDQQAVEGLVERIRPAAGSQMSDAYDRFFDALYALNSDDAYATAFRQLAGPGQPASPATAMLGITGFNNAISSRQSSVQTAAADIQGDLTPSTALAYDRTATTLEARQATAAFASVDRNATTSSDRWSVWGRAFGSWATVDSHDGILGSKSRSGGLSIGADRLLAQDFVGGMAFAFVRTNSSNDDGSAKFDSYNGALYGSWTPGRFVVDMRGALGTTNMSTSRNTILTASSITGSTTGLGGGGEIEVGYRIPGGPVATKPFAGLSGQAFQRRGYTETQAPFGLTFPTETFTKVTASLGVANSILIRNKGWNFMPELRTAWAHDLRDTTLTSQAALLDTPFTVTGVDTGRDAALIGLTLTSWTRESFRLFASYNGEFRTRARNHQASVGIRTIW